MADLTNLDKLQGSELTPQQIRGILAQIDLDIANLLRDGKLSTLKYAVSGPGGQSADRSTALRALLEARQHYQELLDRQPGGWEVSHTDCGEREHHR